MIRTRYLKRGLNALQTIGILIVYGFLKILPMDVSSALMGTLARRLGPLLPVSRLGQENLKHAFPEKSSKDIDHILKGVWENLGRVAGEFPHVNAIARYRTTVIHGDRIQTLQQDNKPGIFLSAHLANWELPHYIVVQQGLPIALISRPPNNPFTKRFFLWVRYHPLVSFILKGPQGTKELIYTFMHNGHIGLLMDQRFSEGVRLPFFNRDAFTAIGPAKLALKYDCPIVPVHVVRKKGVHFTVTFHPPLVASNPEHMTEKINHMFETWIRQHPEQWLWLHNRWKL